MRSPFASSVLIKLIWVAMMGVTAYGVHSCVSDSAPAPRVEDRPGGHRAPPHGVHRVGPSPDQEPPSLLSASDLSTRYAADPLSADARFKGQRIQIEGKVDAMERGQGQVLLITFESEPAGPPLRAVLNGEDQALEGSIQAGDVVRVSCFNRGLLMSQPVLGDCRLVP